MSPRFALAAAALLITPAAAFAAPANMTGFDAQVAYDDLDLTTLEGVSRLLHQSRPA